MKKNERIADAIGNVDENLIDETRPLNLIARKQKPWIKWAASVAACICLVAIAVITIPMLTPREEAQTLWYNNATYYVCGEKGEATILRAVGLPETLTVELCGKQVAYLKSYKNGFVVTEQESDVIMFAYGPSESDNVFIILVNGGYYAAILHDENGYHGLS